MPTLTGAQRQQYLDWFREDWRLQFFTAPGGLWKARLLHVGTGEAFESADLGETAAYEDVRDQWDAVYGPGA